MSHVDGAAALAEVDAEIDAHDPARRSLAPEGGRARSLQALHAALTRDEPDPAIARALARGLRQLARAQLASFPQNLFWDLDGLAALTLVGARESPEPVAALAERFERMAALQELYGQDTSLRFRYVHDFTYGFDWAKWVRRDPAARAAIGPFDVAFLEALRRRGGELLALVEDDDVEYPQLAPGEDRNPFRFSREPADEERLHRSLARDGLIPVAGWRLDPRPDWRRDYARLREQRAALLAAEG
ncbi:MAG: hypothetical protein R3A51_22980 [Nannocystaceae bacterium]|nr:ferrochelatase [Myxococcales bacterium]